jgi:hypothetical protein
MFLEFHLVFLHNFSYFSNFLNLISKFGDFLVRSSAKFQRFSKKSAVFLNSACTPVGLNQSLFSSIEPPPLRLTPAGCACEAASAFWVCVASICPSACGCGCAAKVPGVHLAVWRGKLSYSLSLLRIVPLHCVVSASGWDYRCS